MKKKIFFALSVMLLCATSVSAQDIYSIRGKINRAKWRAESAARTVDKINSLAKAKTKTIKISKLPKNLSELQQMPEFELKDEFEVAALVVAVLCNYESNPEETFKMIDALRGPDPLTNAGKFFIEERLENKQYKTFSFFQGATPKNNYTPKEPLKINVHATQYSYPDKTHATLYLKSGGADTERGIELRKKPSTGQWFVVDFNFLSDIRIPASQDDWN